MAVRMDLGQWVHHGPISPCQGRIFFDKITTNLSRLVGATFAGAYSVQKQMECSNNRDNYFYLYVANQL
jgi:hypothetical protein